jgi:hypothetical protein
LAELFTLWDIEEFVSGGIWFPGAALGVDYKSISLGFGLTGKKKKDAGHIRL